MTTLGNDLWLPRDSRPVLMAPRGVVIGVAPDPDTTRDALALVAMSELGFSYSGDGESDDCELHFQRYCDQFVDLVLLRTEPGRTSIAQRFPREGFPWKADEWPAPELQIVDLLFDVVLQLVEWPSS